MDTLYLRLLLAEVMVQSARRLVPRTPSAYAGSPVLGQEDAQLPSWKYNTKRLLYTSISNEYVPISKHIITLKNRRTQKRISTRSRPTSSHLPAAVPIQSSFSPGPMEEMSLLLSKPSLEPLLPPHDCIPACPLSSAHFPSLLDNSQ